MTDMNALLTSLAASYADEANWRANEDSLFDQSLTIALEGHEVEVFALNGCGWHWSISPHDREEISDDNVGEYSVPLTIAEARAEAFDVLVYIIQTEDEVAAATAAARAAFDGCCALMSGLAPLQKWRVLSALRRWVNEATKNDPFLEQKRNEAFSVGDVSHEPNLSIRSL